MAQLMMGVSELDQTKYFKNTTKRTETLIKVDLFEESICSSELLQTLTRLICYDSYNFTHSFVVADIIHLRKSNHMEKCDFKSFLFFSNDGKILFKTNRKVYSGKELISVVI